MGRFKLQTNSLALLLDSQLGPIGQFVQYKAAQVVKLARDNVAGPDGIMELRPEIRDDILAASPEESPDGIEVRIGIIDNGPISDFLAEKEHAPKEGQSPWLRRALRDAFKH